MPTGSQVRAYYNHIATGEIDPGVFALYKTSDIPQGIKGAIIGIIAKATGGDANRKLALKYLTGSTTSKALTRMQWYALYVLVVPFKDEALGWVSDNPKFKAAMDAVIAGIANEAVAAGQTSFITDT